VTFTDDVDRIMAVMDAAFDPRFGEAWSARQVHDALTLGNCSYRLLCETGEPVQAGVAAAGFYLAKRNYDEEELLLLAVTPENRGRGLGRRLLSDLIGQAQARGSLRILLEMRAGNPAEALYLRLGFTRIGLRPGYYRANDGTRLDAITFALDLK
jgi:ribosomal-protein-alanine N-acetyltransferase